MCINELRNDAVLFVDTFHVYLLPTPNLTVHGECLLQVTSQDILIFDAVSASVLLVRWPLCALRRYGRDQSKFTIESGRLVAFN